LLSNRQLIFSIVSMIAVIGLALTLAFVIFDRQEKDLPSLEAGNGILSLRMDVISDEPDQPIGFVEMHGFNAGSASYLVYVPEPGIYQLSARVSSAASGKASFVIQWNEESEKPWQLRLEESEWEWVPGPEVNLMPGLNKLVLEHKKGDVMIDQLQLQFLSESSDVSAFWVESAPALYVDPESGSDTNDGSSDSPFKTLGKALQVVQPGWHIRLRTGVYREEVLTRRAGLPDARIVIEPDLNHKPVLDGNSHALNALKIVHPYYTVRGLEFRNSNEGPKLEGVTEVVMEYNHIHHMLKECVRIRYFSTSNVIRNNRIHDCGLDGNGEGIYIGTAPEQRGDNQGLPDASTSNVIRRNEMYNVSEGVDIKEDSSMNVVSLNYVHDSYDKISGAINVRSNRNLVYDNLAADNAGSGFRIGGDKAFHPEYGAEYHYGINNIFRQNIARNNQGYGFKIVNLPQDIDESNIGLGNGMGLFTTNVLLEEDRSSGKSGSSED
jgi:hypothetical protein